MSRAAVSSTSTGSGQKVPMFAAKAGFVIPKNKLSGSLVPIFRGVKNAGGSDTVNGESTKLTPRKTKWGPDLSQDASVRRVRAFAYQTRVDQITQQLKSGISEIGLNGNSASDSQSPDHELSSHQISIEKLEELELEKREAIGEILKLNPSYKAPSDYKPLMKEARVSIPVKEYPGYNFVWLIFGPGGENLKRLEKETGAKIQVYRTNIDNGQKIEIKQSDGNEVHNTYEDLYVHISADTFEKVDAAVAVIELLITSVKGNLASASATFNSASPADAHVSLSQDVATSDPIHSSAMQQMPGPTSAPPQGQFQYPGQWFPGGPPPNMILHQPSGFNPPSAHDPNTPAHMSNPPFKHPNMPSLFGRPPVQGGFNSIPQNPNLLSREQQPPSQVLQHQYMAQTGPGPFGPRNPSLMAPQFSSGPGSNASVPYPSTGSQFSPMSFTRPSMPSLPQRVSSLPQGQPANAPPSAGFGNMAPRMVPTHLHQPVASPHAHAPVPVHGSFRNPTLGSAPNPPPGPSMQSGIPNSVSGNAPNFNPAKPQLLAAPSSNSFNFQPIRPQNPPSQAGPRPNNHFAQNAPPANLILPSPASQPLRMPMPNLSQPGNQGFARPPVGNHMGQPQSHMPVSHFTRDPTGMSGPSRLPTFPDGSTLVPRNQMMQGGPGPRNFNPPPQIPNFPGHFPPRPGNHAQHQNYPVQGSHSFASGRSAPAPGEQQLYDPFSPTSMPITPQHQGGFPRR